MDDKDSRAGSHPGLDRDLPDKVAGHDPKTTPADRDRDTKSFKDIAPVASEPVNRITVLGFDARALAAASLRMILILAGAALILWAIGVFWQGILPVILALLLTTVLWPMSAGMRKRGMNAALAALITLLGFLVILVGAFVAMGPVVANQGSQLVEDAQSGIAELFQMLEGLPFDIDMSQVEETLSEITTFIQDQAGAIAGGVMTGVSAATSIIITIVIMLVLVFFFLKDGDKFLPWIRQYSGRTAGWHISELLTRMWNTLSGFIRTQAVVSFVDAFFIGLGLVILGVPLALVLAVLTFFAGFIPIVGAITAGALAVIIALVSNGFTNAIMVLILIILVQQLESNILQPVLQSKAMNLHAAVVLLSVTVGAGLFNIIGAFLAVPVAAVIAVAFRYHSEMVGLRSGEITIDDIEVATDPETQRKKRENSGWNAFMKKFRGKKKEAEEKVEKVKAKVGQKRSE